MTTPSRRAEPQPLGQGWELPLILFTVAAVGAAAAALAGMALAGALAGHGPVWPRGADLARALGGLLTGYPGRGLPPATAARLPAAATVYGFVDAAEVFWLAVCVAGLIVTLRNRRPSDAARRDGHPSRGQHGPRPLTAPWGPHLHPTRPPSPGELLPSRCRGGASAVPPYPAGSTCGAASTGRQGSTASRAPVRPSTCSPPRCSPTAGQRWPP